MGFFSFLFGKPRKNEQVEETEQKKEQQESTFPPNSNNLTKPLQTKIGYIEDKGCFTKTDHSAITDEDIPYLIELGLQHAMEREENSNNPKFHRTDDEKELSFQFSCQYGKEISEKEAKFNDLLEKYFAEVDIDLKIKLLQEGISAFEEAKKWAYSISNGGKIYFQNMWEYCHNSKDECFCYIDRFEGDLEDLIEQRDYEMPEVLKVISENNGILQKDIYNYLPDKEPFDIRRTAKFLENSGQIMRVRKGSTYELSIKK